MLHDNDNNNNNNIPLKPSIQKTLIDYKINTTICTIKTHMVVQI